MGVSKGIPHLKSSFELLKLQFSGYAMLISCCTVYIIGLNALAIENLYRSARGCNESLC